MSWSNSKANSRNTNDTSSLNESTISYRSSITQNSTISSSNHLPPLNTTSNSRPNSTYSRNDSKTSSKINATSEDIVKKLEMLVSRNKTLEEENSVLRGLISEESGKVNFDERRILMLKCQVYQLEKQVNLLSRVLTFRKNAHSEALNVVTFLSETFRSISVAEECRMNFTTTSVSIDRKDLSKWIDLCESARIKLTKSENDNLNEEDIGEPTLFNTIYSKTNQELNLLDICSGNLNHINLKNVALLESDLADLYKKLIRMNESFKTIQNQFVNNETSKIENENKISKLENQKGNSKKLASEYLPLHKEAMLSQLNDCIKTCLNCSNNLFNFSLLVPSAPWAFAKKSSISNLTEETLLKRLKSFNLGKTKHQLVEILLKSYYVASNYNYHMKNLEFIALNEEVKFYRASYSLQKSYIETVIESFKTKYEEFTRDLGLNFKEPLRNLIDKFWLMKNESTEENLKEFLNYFKLNSTKFEEILKNFEQFPQNDLIKVTFEQILIQLENQIVEMNKNFMKKINHITTEMNSTKEFSIQSDLLLNEVLKIDDESINSTKLTINDDNNGF